MKSNFMYYHKTKLFDIDKYAASYQYAENESKYKYNPFSFSVFQQYNPVYNVFFELNDTNYNHISFNHRYSIHSPTELYDHSNNVIVFSPIHIKYSPLLDPVKYLIGKYNINDPILRVLPDLHNKDQCFSKIVNTNNVSYVDNFFCFLSSQMLHTYNMINGIDYYGSYLGVQNIFKFNATDDFDYLHDSHFFTEHLDKDFFCDILYSRENSFANFGSRGNKQKISLEDDVISLSSIISIKDIEHIDTIPPETLDSELEHVVDIEPSNENTIHIDTDKYDDDEDDDEDDDDESYTESDEDESDESDTCSDEDSGDNDDSFIESDEDESDDEAQIYTYIKHFPTQMICLEKCDGTLDQLFVNGDVTCELAAAYLLQIIMTLIVYQKAFHFTHNDLHTNNIMYKDTDIPYLYYCFKNTYYRVPTHGKIFKLIDFGRAIYKYNGKLFCSDSFAPGEDAHTQYNFEPYYNKNKPRVEPNMSFDLCRLGCSIYDFIIDSENPDTKEFDELQKTIYRWCLDDNGKNVVYKKNGEERYPAFKLYRMIARTVHKHTPEAQLTYSFFSQFEVSGKQLQQFGLDNVLKHGINIDTIQTMV